MTACSTSNLDEKCELLKKKENTGVAVLNSLNSIQCQLNPRILSNITKETRRQGTGGARTNNRAGGKREAGILAHQPDLYSFHLSLSQRWWYSMSSVLVEADFPVATGLWRMLSKETPADNPSRSIPLNTSPLATSTRSSQRPAQCTWWATSAQAR